MTLSATLSHCAPLGADDHRQQHPAALHLSEELRSNLVLLDESAARALAIQRGLKVSGTLGVLCEAAQARLLKLPAALDLLRKTNFRASPELWKSLYTRSFDSKAR